MTEVETILKMIETADPADTAKLDEIDARIECYLNEWEFVRYGEYVDRGETITALVFKGGTGWRDNRGNSFSENVLQYTRSRDALKAIRPQGWNFAILPLSDGSFCCRGSYGDPNRTDGPDSDNLRSEELAELYVIIQAVAHDRARAGQG